MVSVVHAEQPLAHGLICIQVVLKVPRGFSAQPEQEGDILPSTGSPGISAHFATPMGVPMPQESSRKEHFGELHRGFSARRAPARESLQR